MPLSKVMAGAGVNFLIPLLGVIVFVLFCRRMRRAEVQSPPLLSYFVLFATFGGWLMVLLTILLWQWSGMASLGVFYLAFVAPLVTGALAWSLRRRRNLSAYHRSAFVASIGYSGVMVTLDLCWMLLGREQLRQAEVYEFPNGFRGWAVVIWDVPGYPKLPIDQGKLV